MDKKIKIRFASRADSKLILSFIRELAEYERLADSVTADEYKIKKFLFSDKSFAECLIADYNDKPVGFALFFHNFSTFVGKPGIYLEDLYVQPEYRGKGIGKALLLEIIRTARKRDCGRVEWAVLDWNKPAISFYESLGAKPMNEWTVFRLDEKDISRLSE
ncbi:MAG: GNAT family N-acetyltransferase [Ignavibacteriaceae bacterium]